MCSTIRILEGSRQYGHRPHPTAASHICQYSCGCGRMVVFAAAAGAFHGFARQKIRFCLSRAETRLSSRRPSMS